MALSATIRRILLADAAVNHVRLVGARAVRAPTALSDWDFEVHGPDLRRIAENLPPLVEPLHPLAHGWDPLGEHRTYMLLLPGPAKVDLILDPPQRPGPPWVVSAETLPAIDHHFWDWTLWLAAKQLRGRHRLVSRELVKMQAHLLEPLGWDPQRAPRGILAAADAYRAARDSQERRLRVHVRRTLEEAVAPAIESALTEQR